MSDKRIANYETVIDNDNYLLIKDIGPWDQYPTITNSAEEVVEDLALGLGERRLFYVDSDGQIDELLVKDSKFEKFVHLADDDAMFKGKYPYPVYERGDLLRNDDGTDIIMFIEHENDTVLASSVTNFGDEEESIDQAEFYDQYMPLGVKVEVLTKILNITSVAMMQAINLATKKTPDIGGHFDERMAYNVLAELGLNFNQTHNVNI